MFEADEHRVLARFATVLASLSHEDSLSTRLCEASRRMLDADGAAATLNYNREGRLTIHATDETSAALEDLQEVVREGPGFDAARARDVVVGRFANGDDDRWPLLRSRLAQMDFRGTVMAIPLNAEVPVLGVLLVYSRSGDVDEDEVTARFLGAAVGTALIEQVHAAMPGEAFGEVWSSRAQIHQGTGMIVAQVGVRPEDALALLRGQAFARSMSLVDVAQEIVDRRINFRDFTIEGD